MTEVNTDASPPDSRRPFRYINKILIPGEEILTSSSISLRAYFPYFLLGGLLALIAMGILLAPDTSTSTNGLLFGWTVAGFAAWLIVSPLGKYFTNQLVLTNRRLIAKIGLISVDTVELKLDKIEAVSIRQSVTGRLFNFGGMKCTGTGGTTQSFPNINGPTRFKLALDSALDRLKHKP